jgi:hypothetical protein
LNIRKTTVTNGPRTYRVCTHKSLGNWTRLIRPRKREAVSGLSLQSGFKTDSTSSVVILSKQISRARTHKFSANAAGRVPGPVPSAVSELS